MSMKVKLGLVLIILVVKIHSVHSFWSANKPSENQDKVFKYDANSQDALTKIYNKPITNMERVERPMNLGPIKHQGDKVTTSDGSEYLIQKGHGYGKDGNTIVVDAKHMSGKWETVERKPVGENVKVGDLVKAGGKDFGTFTDNCFDAATRMEDTAKEG